MPKTRPPLRVERAYENPHSTRLHIIPENTTTPIGYIIYSVAEEYVREPGGKVHKETVGYISDTQIEQEYQRMGILSDCIERVLCDLKCMGATNRVKLRTQCDPVVWKKFGFKESPNTKSKMTIDISDRDCACITCGKVTGPI